MNVWRIHVDRARMRLSMMIYIYICKCALHARAPGHIDMSLPSDTADVKQSMIYCGSCRDFCPSTSFGVLKPKPGKNICDKHPPPELDTKG